ncbi:MAG TPA: AEC family transporter [Patescibacteria group bacterium]|nr:AEC family transporter [Patescibacteria group bacterium]
MAAVNQILVLFIIMFIGVIAKKKNIINETSEKSISTILTKIGMPAMVLSSSSIAYSKEILPNMLHIFLITIVSYIAIIAFGYINSSLFKFEKNTSNVYISLILFANVGFMGYPVARALYGEIGVFYTSIANLVFSTMVWTYGILLFSSKGKLNFKSLVNIGTISSLSGILLFLLQISIPGPLLSALDLTGRMTTPLSMLLIGAMIANVNMKELFSDWKVYWTSFIKLLVIPAVTVFLLKLLNFNEIVVSICTIMAAMPAAATNAIFAKEFDVNPTFASIGVFITTLLCIVTLPLMLYFLTI